MVHYIQQIALSYIEYHLFKGHIPARLVLLQSFVLVFTPIEIWHTVIILHDALSIKYIAEPKSTT